MPKTYLYNDDMNSRPFYVMERISGIILTTNEVKRNINANDLKKFQVRPKHLLNYIHWIISVGLQFSKLLGYIDRQIEI